MDWASVGYAGISDFCITPAYAFLPLAYAALWYGGRLYANRLQANGRLLSRWRWVLPADQRIGGVRDIQRRFYWLGGRYPEPHVGRVRGKVVAMGAAVRPHHGGLRRRWHWPATPCSGDGPAIDAQGAHA